MPGKRKLPSLLTLLTLLAPTPVASQAQPPDKAQRIDQVVSHYQKLGYFNGAILVADRGRVIYSKGAGKASFDYDIPNTPSTKFGIASITKQFTALLVLQQVDETKIALQGKVT